MEPNAFLTGSRVYGTPREDSDIDLVVLVSDAHAQQLADRAIAAGGDVKGYDDRSITVYFGRLNIIATTHPVRFESWRKGTEQLIKQAPVSRYAACEHFKKVFAKEER